MITFNTQEEFEDAVMKVLVKRLMIDFKQSRYMAPGEFQVELLDLKDNIFIDSADIDLKHVS